MIRIGDHWYCGNCAAEQFVTKEEFDRHVHEIQSQIEALEELRPGY